MKKLLALLLALMLCLVVFAACKDEPEQPEETDPVVTYDVNAAISYVFNLYKDKASVVTADFEVTRKVMIGGVSYTVDWTATEGAAITEKDANTYIVDINEKAEAEYSFTLKASVTDPNGASASKEFSFTVPKYEVMSFEDYMKAEADDVVTVEGIVVAINSKSKGNTRNHLFLADSKVTGGYYSYQMDQDPIADLHIEIGMTVTVSGPVAPYSGMQEIKGGTAVIVDSNKKEVAPYDITEAFKTGASLKNYVGLPVTIKGVTIGGQELGGTSEYLFFELDGKKSYIRTYVTDFPTTLQIVVAEDKSVSSPDKATIDAAHKEKFGWTANVSGILVLYNNNPYLIPTSVDCFEYLELIEKTPEEKIDAELEGLKIDASFNSDTEITVGLVGQYYSEVVISWASNSEYAVVDGGKIKFTIPEEATTATITATLKCGDVTKTKEFTVKLSKSVTPVKDIIELGGKQEHNVYTDEKYLVAGVITEVYNTTYGNMKITDDQGNILTIYGTYDATGANRYDAMEKKPVAGDYVVIYGIVGQYNGTPQVKNGWIMSFTTTTSVKDAISTGAGKEHNVYTEDKFLVTGVITEVYNPTYGNMKIKDAEGNILTVYGTYDATGVNRYDAMTKKPVAGDTVTVYGILGQYNGTPQMKNGWIVANVAGASTPETPETPETPDTPSTPSGNTLSIVDAIALGKAQEHNVYTTDKYYVTGVIKSIYNDQYGNMYITDGTNEFCIYGTYSADGSVRFDAMTSKPKVGDTVTIYGAIGQYNGTPQIKNGWITSVVAGEGGSTETPSTPSTPSVPEGPEAGTVKLVLADMGWTNGTQHPEAALNQYITATTSGTAVGSYALNTGKYYDTGAGWRIYQSEEGKLTITAASGKTITSVKITYTVDKTGVLTLNGANVDSDAVVTVNANTITFGVGNTGTATNGQVRISAIEVVYA